MKELLTITPDKDGLYTYSFRRIAEKLMNDYKLQVNDRFFRITECEFYFHDEQNHKDIYTHGHDRQKTSIGEWYFHGSGLDITLAQNGGYGGILIRSMVEIITGIEVPRREDTVKGPLNICTRIFGEFAGVDSRQQNFGLVDISRDPLGANMIVARVFAVPRVGLNAQKAGGTSYIDQAYRFLTFLHLPHTGPDSVKRYLLKEGPDRISASQYSEYYHGTRWY